jgi:hypothetical protein
VPQVAPEGSAPSRHPDGVVIESPSALPSPSTRAEARGVVTLRPGLAPDAIEAVLERWLAAWEHESIDGLAALLTDDAQPLDGTGHGRAGLLDAFRQRFQAHDYTRIAGQPVMRSDRIERWEYDDLDTGNAADATGLAVSAVHPGETLVRVPIDTRESGEKLFGDALLFVLRREDGKLAVTAYGEIDDPK